MDNIYFSDLDSITDTELLGSESTLYNCTFNNKIYLYKQPNHFSNNLEEKIKALSNISNSNLITPKFIIYGDKYKKPIGCLIEYLNKYKSLYYLNCYKEEKIKILKQVKNVIIEMHKVGIIHCDLHIANIMYYNNDVKIIDFDSSKYLNYIPKHFNQYSQDYLNTHSIITKGIDIYNFNVDTFSFIYNVDWNNVFNFDYTVNLNKEQNEVWQKTKEKKELTYDDFLIDRFS